MSGALRVLCAFEDRAFEDVLLPLIFRICEDLELPEPVIRGPLLSRGCRWNALLAILRDWGSEADLIVIGADTGKRTVAQKRSALRRKVEATVESERVLYALPRPCVEGWVQADLQALKQGVEEELAEPIRLPEEAGAYPRDEPRAKERLASVLARSDVPVLRGGLEYAGAVMRHVRFSSEPSLEEFTRELRQRLAGA